MKEAKSHKKKNEAKSRRRKKEYKEVQDNLLVLKEDKFLFLLLLLLLFLFLFLDFPLGVVVYLIIGGMEENAKKKTTSYLRMLKILLLFKFCVFWSQET